VFLPTVAIDRNLGVLGNSLFSGPANFNNGLTVNSLLTINLPGGTNPNFIMRGDGEQTFRFHNTATSGSTRVSWKMADRNNSDWSWIWYTDSLGNGTNDITLANLAGTAFTISPLRDVTFNGTVSGLSFIPSSATIPTNGMYLSAANTLNFATASTNRLSISSAGLVTIPGALTVTGTLTATVANATSSANTLALRQTDGTGLQTPTSAITTSGNRSTSLAPNTYTYGLFSEFKNSTFGLATVGAAYGGLLTYANYDGTTASTGDSSYQILFSPVGGNSTSVPFMQIRAGIDSTWGPWGTVQTLSVNATAKTAAYQLTTADANSIVQMNGAFAFNVNNTLSVLPIGTSITLVAQSAGVSVAANGAAVVPTINATPGLKLRTTWSTATLIKMSAASASGTASTWLLTGDLTA
jgi:hypothetical protein